MTSASSRTVLALQLLLTLATIASSGSNLLKLLVLLVIWAVTFRRLSPGELVFGGAVSVLFIGMNSAALAQGIFSFARPDWLGMPAYEFVMWGYYVLHTHRFIGGATANPPSRLIWSLALLYMAAFSFVSDPVMLLAVTSGLLAIGLFRHHEPLDLAYFGYMVLLGAAVEYTGVWSGEWRYPGDPPLGVPLWFITLWGGVGFFLRRLALPLLFRLSPSTSQPR